MITSRWKVCMVVADFATQERIVSLIDKEWCRLGTERLVGSFMILQPPLWHGHIITDIFDIE